MPLNTYFLQSIALIPCSCSLIFSDLGKALVWTSSALNILPPLVKILIVRFMAHPIIKKDKFAHGVVIDPLVAPVGDAFFITIQYLDRTLIHLDIIALKYFLFKGVIKRLQKHSTTIHPAREGTFSHFPLKITFEDLHLPVKR